MKSIETSLAEIRDDLKHHQEDDARSFDNIERMMQDNADTQKRHDQEFIELKNLIREMAEKNEPVVAWFENINFSKRAIMWLLTIVGSVVAISIGIQTLLRKS